MAKETFFDTKEHAGKKGFVAKHTLDLGGLMQHKELLSNRPQKTELFSKLAKFGLIIFDFPLDYGSFRDLQRHRNGICEMPLLSTRHGFAEWYLDQLTPSLKTEAGKLIQTQIELINALPGDDSLKQYFIALGFNVPCQVAYSLPQTIYVAELRSSQTVHPTLRKIAQKMALYIKEIIPTCTIHADMNEDEWNIKRGTQDIVKKV
jgi:hypothetical protein